MFMFRKKDDDAPIDVEDLGLDVILPEPAPISVVTLAAELGEPVDQLVRRLGDDVYVEERSGLRCVSVEVCRRVLDERNRWRAKRDRQAREARERTSAALRERAAAARTAPDPRLQALADTAFSKGPR